MFYKLFPRKTIIQKNNQTYFVNTIHQFSNHSHTVYYQHIHNLYIFNKRSDIQIIPNPHILMN